LFAVAVAASGAMLLIVNGRLGFFLDEWDLLLHRRGFSADAIFSPHNEHIVVGPALVYKAIQTTFGMDSPRPYQAVAIALFLTSVVLLFALLRRRVGEWLALLGAVPILFLGSAWEDLLSAFQMGYFGSMAAGLGALLALDSGPRRDALACALLILSVAFSSVGLPFVAGAAVAVALRPRPLRSAWVAALPALLFAAWWIGWGHTADTRVTFDSVANTPAYVLDGVASSITALLGLSPADSVGLNIQPDWGRILLVGAVGLAAWRLHRLGSAPRTLWVPLAVALGFWALAAWNSAILRVPTLPRYVYVGAILLILVVAELVRGLRLPRWGVVAMFCVAAVAIAANTINLREGYRVFKSTADANRAGVTALELARETVDPGLVLAEDNSGTEYFHLVDAASYLSAADAFGSPAYSEEELRAAPEPARAVADRTLVTAERIALVPDRGPLTVSGPAPVIVFGRAAAAPQRPGCVRKPTRSGAVIALPAGGTLLRAGPSGEVKVKLRRFAADEFTLRLGTVPSGGSALVDIPVDRGSQPWQLALTGPGEVTVCGGAS
jgi:hypothetical protein